MRRSFIAGLGLTGILMIGACSSSTEEKSTTQANTATATANAQNANAAAITNGAEVAGPQSVPANATNAAAADAMPNMMEERMNQMRKVGEAGPPVNAAEVARKNARPAPDNSTFSTYLTDAGYEIREFKNHPQLLRVEKKIESNGHQTLKIYLRDGKVVELPGQRITVLSSATAQYILEQAGIKPVQPKPPVTGPAESKKSAVN